ncbi:MAG: hypothetical protein IMZ71_03360 [Chloroflexi bacterium]|nr:hypothetical protein [Chloroflexota bacterium]
MKNCPQCGALAVLFADYEKNDQTAIGLRCAVRCGWRQTMADLRRQRDDAIGHLKSMCSMVEGDIIEHVCSRHKLGDYVVDKAQEAIAANVYLTAARKFIADAKGADRD